MADLSQSPSIGSVPRLTLNKNLHSLNGLKWLTSGAGQNNLVKVRDFCLGVSGLLALAENNLVKQHLQLFLDHVDSNGRAPYAFGSHSPNELLSRQLFKGFFFSKSSPPLTALNPYFIDEFGNQAHDVNLYLLKASTEYAAKSHDFEFFLKNEMVLQRLYSFYDSHTQEGLIHQPAFSDWMNTLSRKGASFLTNMLYLLVTEELSLFSPFHHLKDRSSFLRKNIETRFWCPQRGLFRSMANKEDFSLADQLLAIRWHFVTNEKRADLYAHIVLSTEYAEFKGPLWCSQSTEPTTWSKSLLGFSRLHKNIGWSWLVCLFLKTTLLVNDSERTQSTLSILDKLKGAEGLFPETFQPSTLTPFSCWPYKTDVSSTLSALMLAESMELIEKLQTLFSPKS